MKTMTISLLVVLLFTSVLPAQQPDLATIRSDMFAVLKGDVEKFERGMRGLESLLAKNPNDPVLKVLHGMGVFAHSGEAFKKGDMQNAMKLYQSGLDEMAQAVELAPDNILVRARRGVILISASRAMPAA